MDGIEHYAAPRTLDEAADLLRAGDATVLAGGTDLMPQASAGRIRFKRTLLNVSRVDELRGIAEAGGHLRIGALTTVTELLESALVRAKLRVLWEACDHFASDQIRNAATVGGNLCNASPAGDTLVPLLVLDARVVLAGKPNGTLQTRKVPLSAFLTGPGKTMRAAHELLTGVEIPELPEEIHELSPRDRGSLVHEILDFALVILLAAVVVASVVRRDSSPAGAQGVRLLVQSSPLAGYRYAEAAAVWPRLRVGDELTLAREPDNPHDANAVRVDYKNEGQPMLFGLRVVPAVGMTADNVAVGAFAQHGTIYNREGVIVELSDSDSDNFTKNLITVRAERRLALTSEVPAAIRAGDLTPL